MTLKMSPDIQKYPDFNKFFCEIDFKRLLVENINTSVIQHSYSKTFYNFGELFLPAGSSRSFFLLQPAILLDRFYRFS
jgi:hypothetical protein